MGITEQIVTFIINLISVGGYPTVAFLMMLESMVVPVPSEAVMPFVGFLITTNTFSFWSAFLAGLVGSFVGSFISYYMGYYGGDIFLNRWGKYFLLNERHLEMTEKFFAKYGEITIFFGRLIPVVRHFISIPAGIGKMNKLKFSFYTIIGAGIWNMFLMYIGIILGNNWEKFGQYNKVMDIVVVAVILLLAVYWVYRRRCCKNT